MTTILTRGDLAEVTQRFGERFPQSLANARNWRATFRAALFIESGRFDIPIMHVVVQGTAALREFASGLQRTISGLHHVMTNFTVDIDGDRARGRCALNEFLLRPEAIYNCLQGWYEDEYVRSGNRWLFAVRRVFFRRDWSRVTTTGPIGDYFKSYLEFCRQYRRPN